MSHLPATCLPFPSAAIANYQQHFPHHQLPQYPPMQQHMQQQQVPAPWSYGQYPGQVQHPQTVYVPSMNQFVPSPPLNLHLNLNVSQNPMNQMHHHTNMMVKRPLALTPTVSSGSSLTPSLSTPSPSASQYSLSPGPQSRTMSMSPPAKRACAREQRFIVIFDWDDTLFPTSTVVHNEESKKKVTAEELHQFGKVLYSMLAEYISVFGHQNLFIVTNGAAKWYWTFCLFIKPLYLNTI